MMNRPALRFANYAELIKLIALSHQRFPNCRPGQALCHAYGMSPEWESAIWELKTRREVFLSLVRLHKGLQYV